MQNIKLLDCTLRDGAYINDALFGADEMRRILSGLADSGTDIIECGWLKDAPHRAGTSYYNKPSDMLQYLPQLPHPHQEYVAMIDWNRYDLAQLPENDGKSISAIRIVFPRGKAEQAAKLGLIVKDKGYDVYMQPADTMSYSDNDMKELVAHVNRVQPVSVAIVDTFGKMFPADFDRLYQILNKDLEDSIGLGLHTHNNLLLGFANVVNFLRLAGSGARSVFIDSSLCGFGRGAGNAPTELCAHYLNKQYGKNYDLGEILGIIDDVFEGYANTFTWGYDTPMFLAGMYGSHVNNAAYLKEKYGITNRDFERILNALSPEKRVEYDYDNLQHVYRETVACSHNFPLSLSKRKVA